jgi:N-hydroxyarylamine O-acetyltransferase
VSGALDLDAYFERIGYSGRRDATLETLKELHRKHPEAIAFENLDPILGRPVPLDMPSLEAKLIRARRGGYCFEQNGIFFRVLQMMGFHATGLSARVLRGRPEKDSPRSHMLMKIELEEGTYVADIGFGSLTLTAPLRLDDEAPQETPHGQFRIVEAGDEFELQALLDEGWQTQYRFALQEYFPQDYEALNWYRATHPQSPFVTSLMAARPLSDRRLGLRNNHYAVRHLDGRTDRFVLGTAAEVLDVLEGDFGIALPEPRSVLENAISRIMRDAAQ